MQFTFFTRAHLLKYNSDFLVWGDSRMLQKVCLYFVHIYEYSASSWHFTSKWHKWQTQEFKKKSIKHLLLIYSKLQTIFMARLPIGFLCNYTGNHWNKMEESSHIERDVSLMCCSLFLKLEVLYGGLQKSQQNTKKHNTKTCNLWKKKNNNTTQKSQYNNIMSPNATTCRQLQQKNLPTEVTVF